MELVMRRSHEIWCQPYRGNTHTYLVGTLADEGCVEIGPPIPRIDRQRCNCGTWLVTFHTLFK